MLTSPAHIAGIGLSEESNTTTDKLVLSAVTIALLDAGITYRDVDQDVVSSWDEQSPIPRSCFSTLGPKRPQIHEVKIRSALYTAVECIRARQKNCVLIVGIDKVSVQMEPIPSSRLMYSQEHFQ